MTNESKIKQVVDFDELYPGRFIKSGEFQGKKVTLTITDVITDELHDAQAGKKRRGIVSFRESEKQWVLNKTNGLCLKAMFGRCVVDWIGKKITLYPADYMGDTAIRVWGSPDIEADFTAKIELPRKKPFDMVMHATGKKSVKPTATKEDYPPAAYDEPPDYGDNE